MRLLRSIYNTLKFPPVPAFISLLIRGPDPLERSPRKASLQSLPNELLLEIFSCLELKPYIICHGVCQKWHGLLPLTKVHPIRKRLLDLYNRILSTPGFEKALEWTNRNLQSFDREEYIRCLSMQYPVIPEEFRMWILEWPARLVIQCTWPGLPFIHCRTSASIIRRLGVNWIAHRPFSPQLSSLVYKEDTPSQTFIPGLLIWRYAGEAEWLVFEKNEPHLFGRVFRTHSYYHSTGSIPFHRHREEIEGDINDSGDEDADPESVANLITFEDWIKYLESLWHETSKEICYPSKIHLYPDHSITQPIMYEFDGPGNETLPAPPWDSCQRTMDRWN